MTTILTLQPNATQPGSPTFGGLTIVGAASYHAAVNDSSDATYIQGDNLQGGTLAFNFPDPTSLLPATGWLIESLQLRIRSLADAAAFASGQFSPWWFHSYIALGDGFSASATFHNKTLSIYDTQNLPGGGAIYDRYTNLVTYLDDGTHVRSMLWGSVMQIVLGSYPTLAGYHRLYKVELLIRYNSLPVVTVPTLPANPSNSTRPVVQWTYADADLEPQQSFRVIVVKAGVPSTRYPYGLPGNAGYQPDGATEIAWDSGTFFGTGNQIQVGPGLVNGQTYYAYVQAQTVPAAGIPQNSQWAFKQFTITTTGPANPTVVVTSDPTLARNHIVVRESSTATPHPVRYTVERVYEPLEVFEPVRGGTYTASAEGFLTPAAAIFSGWSTPDHADFTFTNGMTVRARVTLADYTHTNGQNFLTQALQSGNKVGWRFGISSAGLLEFAWSSTSAGASFDQLATATTATGATDGQEAVFEARVVLNTNPWSVQFWRSLDGGQTWLQVGATVTGAGPKTMVNSTHVIGTGGYDNYLWGQMNGLIAEGWIWNSAGVLLTNPKWQGLAPKTASFIDLYGRTWSWNTGPNGYLKMQLDIYDYEAPLGIPVRYEALAWRDDTDIVAGSWVATSPVSNTLPAGKWWLKDPLVPERNMVVSVVSLDETIQKPMTVGQTIGAVAPGTHRAAVVAHSGTRGSMLRATFRSLDKDTFDAILALWRGGQTLLLQNIHGRQWYVQAADVNLGLIKAAPAVGESFVLRHAYEWQMDLVEVAPPTDQTAGVF